MPVIDFLTLVAIFLVPLAMGWWPCDACFDPCTLCDPDYRGAMKAVVANFKDENCDDCTDINGTYILPQVSSGSCEWRKNESYCNSTLIKIRLYFQFPNYRFEGIVEYGPNCPPPFEPPTSEHYSQDRNVMDSSYGTTAPDCTDIDFGPLDYITNIGVNDCGHPTIGGACNTAPDEPSFTVQNI